MSYQNYYREQPGIHDVYVAQEDVLKKICKSVMFGLSGGG